MWKKLVETIANIGILFFCVQTEFMIFYKLKGVGDFFRILWKYESTSGIYGIITKIYDECNYGKTILWVSFFIILFFIFGLLYILLKKFVRKKLLIIEHLSFQNMNFTYVDEELKEYNCKKYRIDQCEILNSTTL